MRMMLGDATTLMLLLTILTLWMCPARKPAKPVQRQPAGHEKIVIASPQPDSLGESPLIVQGTNGTAAGNVATRLIAEDGHRVIPMNLSVAR